MGSLRRGRGHIEDLAGNVWEWTASGPSSRSIRGGSFASTVADELQAAGELRVDPQTRRADLGLRCVWDPAPGP